jgi:putative acetyltransferase
VSEPDWTIRGETASDRAAVLAVNAAAFGGEAEAELVARLWDDGDALFGFVAEAAGRVVGHVLFSQLPIAAGQGIIPAAALAPLAVLPAWQRRGIGAALVRRGLATCRERGIAAVVVLGDPAYYERFGFRAETARGLETPWSGPHLMALEVTAGAMAMGSGMASYPPAFAAVGANAGHDEGPM